MEPMLGQLMLFAGNFAPRGWAQCNGQLLPIASNTALFSLLGTTYGGDGKVTFALPNLCGRTPSHYGQGPGYTLTDLGEPYGTETNTMLITEMPPHTHVTTATTTPACNSTDAEDSNTPVASFFRQTPGTDTYASSTNAVMGASNLQVTIGVAGGSQPINNIQPSLGLNYCIALEGIYPSRP